MDELCFIRMQQGSFYLVRPAVAFVPISVAVRLVAENWSVAVLQVHTNLMCPVMQIIGYEVKLIHEKHLSVRV